MLGLTSWADRHSVQTLTFSSAPKFEPIRPTVCMLCWQSMSMPQPSNHLHVGATLSCCWDHKAMPCGYHTEIFDRNYVVYTWQGNVEMWHDFSLTFYFNWHFFLKVLKCPLVILDCSRKTYKLVKWVWRSSKVCFKIKTHSIQLAEKTSCGRLRYVTQA